MKYGMTDNIQVGSIKHPTLYKKTNTGAIQSWSIQTESNVITTTFGQVDGKQQILHETISEGKNIGKANETNPSQQATAEALSKWEKQAKKGYVIDIEVAKTGAVDEAFIKGGVLPMLAPSKIYGDDANLTKKIVYPAFVQPKLDGSRCIAIIESDGQVSLWSRTRKAIKSVPHIVEALQRLVVSLSTDIPEEGIVLDGELYNHAYRDRFGELMSIIRKDEPDPDGKHLDIQYHIYDMVNDLKFSGRTDTLGKIAEHYTGPLEHVETFQVKSKVEVFEHHDYFKGRGYEGAMVRNDALYEGGKRSKNLQKVKTFDDEEFEVIDVKAGRGKFAKCATFICRLRVNEEFDCAAPGTIKQREAFLADESSWKGKKLTVKFQGWTDAENKPRFPVAKAIRDYE